TVFLGAVGDDPFGTVLRDNLMDCGIDTRGVRVVPGVSGVAHIVVDAQGGSSIIVIPGATGTATSTVEGDAALIGNADALLLQLELPMEAVVAAARVGRELGVPVYLTPAPARELPAELLENVDVLVPNEHEAAAITGQRDPERAVA